MPGKINPISVQLLSHFRSSDYWRGSKRPALAFTGENGLDKLENAQLDDLDKKTRRGASIIGAAIMVNNDKKGPYAKIREELARFLTHPKFSDYRIAVLKAMHERLLS